MVIGELQFLAVFLALLASWFNMLFLLSTVHKEGSCVTNLTLPLPTPLRLMGFQARSYRPTSVLNHTNALMKEWEQISAARFQKSVYFIISCSCKWMTWNEINNRILVLNPSLHILMAIQCKFCCCIDAAFRLLCTFLAHCRLHIWLMPTHLDLSSSSTCSPLPLLLLIVGA